MWLASLVVAVVEVVVLLEVGLAVLELLIKALQEQMVTGARPFKVVAVEVLVRLAIQIPQGMAAMGFQAT
jgi:hypothetical protein